MNQSFLEVIQTEQNRLIKHPVYEELKDLSHLKLFMETHVFAVWDFMSLLKSLQREITCISVPWRPSGYSSELLRFINQIVLGEESDIDQNGKAVSHFELYLRGMEEIGADTRSINAFIRSPDRGIIPESALEFVSFNLNLALTGTPVQVASAFFYGREKLIPEMFDSILKILDSHQLEAPTFKYYLERHIEVDGGEHGPLAEKCLKELIGDDPDSLREAQRIALESLKARYGLWDNVLKLLQK
jgi:hypothetical protein